MSTRKEISMAHSKTCFKCDKNLPATEFYGHPAMGDGHLGKCKECTKADVIANRLKRVDYYRKYDLERAKNPERAKAAAAISKRWRQSDKRITKCHNAVVRAIRKGTLERLPCCVCGRVDTMAHHESYDRPLDVVFYCQPHHKERHKEMVLKGIEP